MPLRMRDGQTKALACLTLMNEEHRASHGRDGEVRDERTNKIEPRGQHRCVTELSA